MILEADSARRRALEAAEQARLAGSGELIAEAGISYQGIIR